MIPAVIYHISNEQWLGAIVNLTVSAAVAIGILAREGQLRRASQ